MLIKPDLLQNELDVLLVSDRTRLPGPLSRWRQQLTANGRSCCCPSDTCRSGKRDRRWKWNVGSASRGVRIEGTRAASSRFVVRREAVRHFAFCIAWALSAPGKSSCTALCSACVSSVLSLEERSSISVSLQSRCCTSLTRSHRICVAFLLICMSGCICSTFTTLSLQTDSNQNMIKHWECK